MYSEVLEAFQKLLPEVKKSTNEKQEHLKFRENMNEDNSFKNYLPGDSTFFRQFVLVVLIAVLSYKNRIGDILTEI